LKIVSADFVVSVDSAASSVLQAGLPQIAFAGRSNVGKSSLINALVRRTIARTSAAPGKTRLVNIYRVELGNIGRTALYLVDLPGYGYARGGSSAAAELQAIAEAYLTERRAPRAVTGALLLVDSRHPTLASDRHAAEWLESLGIDAHIVATKIDKLTRQERVRNLKTIGETFERAVLPVSAVSGEGLDELWRTIVRIARDADKAE
jgi:GTP-binding protein